MKKSKRFIFMKGALIAICFTFAFCFSASNILAGNSPEKAPSIRTEEVTTYKTYTDGLSTGYVYFTSKADIQDVTDIIQSIHSYYVYARGAVTYSNDTYVKNMTNRSVTAGYDWALGAMNTGKDSQRHYY